MSVAVLDVEVPAHRDRSVDIEDRMRDVAGVVNLAHAQLVELVAEAIETGAWQVNGIRTPAHWVSWQAGLSTGHAHEIVRLAEARVTHPAVMSTFAGGAISVDQAAAATNTPSYLDDHFADLATVSTVSQLKVMARAARPAPPSPTPPTADEPARGPQPVPESFAGWFDDEGRYHLRGELDPDHGRLLDAALREARDALFHAGRSGVTWADALVELAQRSLDVTTSAARRDRFRVLWFVDPTDPVPARWADGLAVPAWLIDLLSCDGTVAPVYTAGARPFSVGTSVATIPDRTRRYVLFRDQTCRVPWCPQHQWLQVHHVTHRADHGTHDTANLAALCPACHRAHHRGELGITGNADQPDGLTFTDRHGHLIDPTTRPTPPTRPPPRPAEPYVHPLGERLDHWAVVFPDPPPNPTTNEASW